MRIKVDIILGFLGSLKTSLINSFLANGEVSNEKIVIIQYEKGHTSINEDNNLIVLNKKINEGLTTDYLKKVVSKYLPDRIIIEYNGMTDAANLMEEINTSYFAKIFMINKVISIVDSNKTEIYLRNFTTFFLSHITYSNLVIINNCNKENKKAVKDIINFIKTNECHPKIFKIKDLDDLNKKIKDKKICLNYYNEKVTFDGLLKILLIIFSILFIFTLVSYINLTRRGDEAVKLFTSFKVNFISILLEAFPFILIGSFVSSLIQICIPDEWIYKIFKGNKLVSSITASILGLLFPICDCGTIPLALGFLNKGVPLNAVIAFMLSAPIMNPISIISTYYAFQSSIRIVFLRVVLGISISVISSLILGREKKENIVNDFIGNCNCDLCNGTYKGALPLEKFNGILKGTADEFFKVSKFLIVGALFTSLLQLLNSYNMLSAIPKNNISYLLFMMLIAFLLSICSTSDAFVAKGFLNIAPMNSILGFLVLGPMIDIKNTIMLTAYFKKSFILRYIFIVLIISFLVFKRTTLKTSFFRYLKLSI